MPFILCSCEKPGHPPPVTSTVTDTSVFLIRKGNHYCDQTGVLPFSGTDMHFKVWFNQSAIYKTTDPENQNDINKLFGFSDNGTADHHLYSARFGWRWSDGGLLLFAYVYNNSIRTTEELMQIEIGKGYNLSIQVVNGFYKFSINDNSFLIERKALSQKAEGYRLFPYFGGNESSPHDIYIHMNAY